MSNTLKLGRITITSPGSLSFTGGTSDPNRSMSISGVLSSNNVNEAKSLRDELISMAKSDVPIALTYTGDSTLKGYCRVTDASVNIPRYTIASISYSISLEWYGKPGEINLESHFSGALITNSHSITSTTNQFHAVPPQAYNYHHTGTLTTTTREIDGESNIVVRTGGNLRNSNATFNVEPENYYEGAVEIRIKDYNDTLRLRAGKDSDNKPTDAEIKNGLIKLVFLGDNTSQCRFTTSLYDPDQNTYASPITWAISATGSATEWQSWQSIQILKNEPQIATLRCTTHYNAATRDGRLVFDVTMKRGAQHLEFVASQYQAQQLNIKSTSALAGTNATGYVKATSADNQGNKYIIGTPSTYTADTTNLGISVSSTTTVKGFIGAEIGTVSGANTADSIRDQYIDSIFETVRVVKS
tara:strand:- start:149 stop:1390 length:1242 start_codon:yes stop_codon:yes gene_type:complete